MNAKVLEILRNDPKTPAKEIAQLLSFSDTERKQVERATVKQWECKEWYLHKAGFISPSKCKRVFTRQETLDKNPAENAKNFLDYPIGLVNSTINVFILSKPEKKIDDGNTIRIVLPFKDQIAANAVRRQLRDISRKICVTLQPIFVSKKLEQDLKPKEIKPSMSGVLLFQLPSE